MATTSRALQNRPYTTQLDRVLYRFGGTAALKRALDRVWRNPKGIDRTTIRNWCKRNDGLIPTGSLPYVLLAAKNEGVYLSDRDLNPGKLPIENRRDGSRYC